MTLLSVLGAFGIGNDGVAVEPFGNGLIHHTWKVKDGSQAYILQKVNTDVFAHPEYIAGNVRLMARHLAQHYPGYLFVTPLLTTHGTEMAGCTSEGFFRLLPFVPGSQSYSVVETPEQAFEAAVQFGRFTRLLSGLDVGLLQPTIPQFHDLSLRYQQFATACRQGNGARIQECAEMIAFLKQNEPLAATFRQIVSSPFFKQRVTHHDTKISNVLFDANGKGLCVIDLDTAMPGYFISDVGDMMRTFLPPVSEEEPDFAKIEVRDDFYRAIVQGYYSEMRGELTPEEQTYFFYAGQFMIYMQALRFLTDYFNNDAYYGARYPGQNKVRAGNQITLLRRLMEKETLYRSASFLG